jgi:hypothetical protein
LPPSPTKLPNDDDALPLMKVSEPLESWTQEKNTDENEVNAS